MTITKITLKEDGTIVVNSGATTGYRNRVALDYEGIDIGVRDTLQKKTYERVVKWLKEVEAKGIKLTTLRKKVIEIIRRREGVGGSTGYETFDSCLRYIKNAAYNASKDRSASIAEKIEEAAEELEVELGKEDSVSFDDIVTLSKIICPLLVSSPGGGKTSWVRENALQRGYKFVDLPIACMDASDFIGFPYIEEGKLKYAQNAEIESLFNERCVLFLDELNGARDELLVPLQKLLIERRIAGREIHPETVIVAAMNPLDEATNAAAFSTAFRERFCEIPFKSDYTNEHILKYYRAPEEASPEKPLFSLQRINISKRSATQLGSINKELEEGYVKEHAQLNFKLD